MLRMLSIYSVIGLTFVSVPAVAQIDMNQLFGGALQQLQRNLENSVSAPTKNNDTPPSRAPNRATANPNSNPGASPDAEFLKCELKDTKQAIVDCLLNAHKIQYENSLKPALVFKKQCGGSEKFRATRDTSPGYFFSTPVPAGFFELGSLATNDNNKGYCSVVVSLTKSAMGRAAKFLVPPAGWKKIWDSKNLNERREGSIWRPTSPDPDFVCLGDVIQSGLGQPSYPQYRCINKRYVKKVTANKFWDSSTSGSSDDSGEEVKVISAFKFPVSGLFLAGIQEGNGKEVFDIALEKNSVQKPDPAALEKLLQAKKPAIESRAASVIAARIQERARQAKLAAAAEKRRAAAEKRRKEQAKRQAELRRIEKEKAEKRRLAALEEKKKRRLAAEKAERIRKAGLKSAFGFRGIKIGMTEQEINREANCGLKGTLGNSSTFTCYGLQNYKFKFWFPYKDRFVAEIEVSPGPLTQSLLGDLFTTDNPQSGNIFTSIKASLDKKYKKDFSFTDRDRQLFNERKKKVLRNSYENGQISHEIRREAEGRYNSNNNVYIVYRSKQYGLDFLKEHQPKRAKASDF
jgi:flagellar biosynthesis GTPase FlhF